MAAGAQFRHDRSHGSVESETAAISRRRAQLAASAVALFLATGILASCKNRPPDLTVLTSSPEQITYEVSIESPLFSSTRAPTPNEVIAAAERFCAQHKKKAVFVRVVQRASNMQNITYDCMGP